MITVNFVDHKKVEHSVEVAIGESLMEAAKKAGVEGIVAACGGKPACATCRVYVPEDFANALPPRSDAETTVLEAKGHGEANVRLSCQLVADPGFDNIKLIMPEAQR